MLEFQCRRSKKKPQPKPGAISVDQSSALHPGAGGRVKTAGQRQLAEIATGGEAYRSTRSYPGGLEIAHACRTPFCYDVCGNGWKSLRETYKPASTLTFENSRAVSAGALAIPRVPYYYRCWATAPSNAKPFAPEAPGAERLNSEKFPTNPACSPDHGPRELRGELPAPV